MIKQIIPLVDWGNGVIMIGVFVLVVVALIAFLVYYMSGGSKEEESDKQ